MVVFGGGGPGGNVNDVWVLFDANGIGNPVWQPLTPVGTAPSPRVEMAGGYDPASNRLIVFGGHDGAYRNDLWILSNANGVGGSPRWEPISPLGSPPPPRHLHGAAYDPESNRLIVYGLVDSDVWILIRANGVDGIPEWTRATPTGGALPVPRYACALQYTPSGRLVVATGRTATGPTDEVWRAALAGPLAKASILDDDPLPAISIADAPAVVEGDTGTRDAVFTVTVSPPSGQTLRVVYSTVEGTARPGVDYVSRVDALSVPAAVSTAAIRIPIQGDPFPENTETFTVRLTPTPHAVVVRAEALGTITDDDPTDRIPVPFVSDISPTAVVPGGPGLDLTVRGANFVRSSIVRWNGANRVTTFVSSRELAATIAAADIAAAGTARITVVNAGPGGGTSNEAYLPLTSPAAGVAFSRVELASGDGPRYLASADLNRDGHMDLVVVNNASNTVSLWMGNGDGTFGGRTDYPTASGPHALALGDVNGDGAADLCVLHGDAAGTMSVFLGNGDSTLAPRTDLLIGSAVGYSNTIAVGDYNRDGRVDFALADRVSQQVRILLGLGGGAFQTPGYAYSIAAPHSVAAADFNSDGRLDLGVHHLNGFEILLGAGDGNFSPGTFYTPAEVDHEYITDADLDQDGHLDVILAAAYVYKFLGNGDGTFQFLPPGHGPQAHYRSLGVSDFNADGHPDVATANGVDVVSVLLGDGSGHFVPKADFGAAGVPYAVAVADFNGDGKPDLAVSNHTSSTVSIFLATPPPTLSAGDVSLEERHSGSTNAIFTVTLDPPTPALVSVAYATADGTAVAGSDYQPVSGTLVFDPGTTTRTITVPVFGDVEFELHETFRVNFTDAVGAELFADYATGTIRNDDDGYALSVSDVTVTEGHAGTEAVFTVSMALSSPQTVTVDYATADGTAGAGFDYLSASGTLTFPPGTTSQPVSVTVVGDIADEPDEGFFLDLANPTNALIVDGRGQATIVDDDPEPTVSIGDATVVEGDSVTTARFTVTLSNPSSREVRVAYASADGTARAGTDYLPASGTLLFSPGMTARDVGVTVIGDAVPEPDETFFVNLSVPINAAIGDGQGQGTIRDDDTLARAEISSPPPGSGLAQAAVTFTWGPGVGASRYWLSVGTTPGGTQLYHEDQGLALSREVTGLPTDGRPIHVRLWTLLGTEWQFGDYGYNTGSMAKGFYTVTPCRLADTRDADGPLGGPALVANQDRTFPLAGQCNVPLGATSLSLNLTVAQATAAGNLALFPGGTPPSASAINYAAGQTRANNGILRLSPAGELVVRCRQPAGTAHLILDVNGFFVE
jgi:hypothetical protein